MNARVVLGEDHRLLREGVKSLLQKSGFEVAGEAGDGRSAVKLATKLAPDVVILDISMPLLNGIEATKQICSAVPEAKVIVMSMHSASHFILGALHAGAVAYLLLQKSGFEVAGEAGEGVGFRRTPGGRQVGFGRPSLPESGDCRRRRPGVCSTTFNETRVNVQQNLEQGTRGVATPGRRQIH